MARQPKHDYLGQLAGRGIERQDRTRKFRGDSFHKTANVTPNQASVLNKHIAQENMYFNELIDILQPRLRNNPEFFSELTDEHIALFSLIAFCSFDVRSLLKKKSTDTELPPRLEPYRHILFGIHGDKEEGLSDKLTVLYDRVGSPIKIWPYTREYMAHELMSFCLTQAKVFKTGRRVYDKVEQEDTITYSTNPESLQNASLMQKRHIQLLKKDVQLTWDEKNDKTLIKIPQIVTPLSIDGLNIIEQFPQWTIMVIHQNPQDIILTNSHWEIDFKTSFSKYLIKYLECMNPDSQMLSRHLKKRK